MDTRALEKFAQAARRQLHEQVGARLERVLRTDSAELRARAEAVAELNKQIAQSSRETVIERVAYTWFNRFCALRYMDANRYTRMGVVSPAPGFTQSEILQEAKQGHIDEALIVDRQRVFDLLAERVPSRGSQQEAYRLLMVSVCNDYHRVMPFMFQRIDDYTELLMPDDLLSSGSILQATREALTEEACQDVEIIGWLYQFYISEKKDEVIGSKKKIQAEDIPAATQLFTPHWIVRYLVENSLGRLWLLNKPRSRLAERMEYYIKPQQEESDFLCVNSPEELTVCDPAVGSGHMLTYTFDLLYAIYEEEGYNPSDIPRMILEKNLVGLEIDERAGVLAAFALTMKARAKDRRFLRRGVKPRITVLHPPAVYQEELQKADWFRELGRSLLGLPVQDALLHDLGMLRQVDNIGSLLRPKLTSEQIAMLRERINAGSDLFSHALNTQALGALAQLEPLTRRYHVVVANPPYMGGGGQNESLKKFLRSDYKDYKADLFSAFIVRNLELALPQGRLGFMTPFVWMFISSYEKLRKFLIENKTITSLIQLEYSGFEGATVPICTFTLVNAHKPKLSGGYIRLSDFRGASNQAPKTREAIRDPECGWFYNATAVDFQKIPGCPIAYSISNKMRENFDEFSPIDQVAEVRKGLVTLKDKYFIKYWFEVDYSNLEFNVADKASSLASTRKWFPINKGGGFRKWYGLNESVINWYDDGKELKDYIVQRYGGGSYTKEIRSEGFYFKPNITWGSVTSGPASFRSTPPGFLFSSGGSSLFPKADLTHILAFLNSKIAAIYLRILAPTLNFGLLTL